VPIGFEPVRAGCDPARRTVEEDEDADFRTAGCDLFDTTVCDTRGRTAAVESSPASAPQCWQNDFVSDERRPQFWHSMREF
jgi:hypothetical protein